MINLRKSFICALAVGVMGATLAASTTAASAHGWGWGGGWGHGGWGFGAAAGWIQQLEDDDGPTADRLGGFSGHSLGIGPALAYKKSFSKESSIDVSLRWIKEFRVKNRLKGEPLVLSVAIAL